MAGSIAGSVDKTTGYVRIRIDRRIYQAHRLAWFYVTGEWPANDIDHRDTVRHNNRWLNLRDVTHRTNGENRRRAHKSNQSSGLLGASWDAAKGRWMSHITLDYRFKFLGYYDTAQEAHQKYVETKRQVHAGCTI